MPTGRDWINAKYVALGGKDSELGRALEDVRPTFDTIGRTREFRGGTISWHPEAMQDGRGGAFAIMRSEIQARWFALGRELYGYPIADQGECGDGRGYFNHFRTVHLPHLPEASIYFTPETGACEVRGAIRAKYASLGFEKSRLGYPRSDEHDGPNGARRSDFEHGYIEWANGVAKAFAPAPI